MAYNQEMYCAIISLPVNLYCVYYNINKTALHMRPVKKSSIIDHRFMRTD